MSTIRVLDHIEKSILYIAGNFEKKKLLPLTNVELKLHQDATNYYICEKVILKKLAKSKSYQKVRDHRHYIS